jgi:F420-dependent oxidoreductase-like protein
MKLSVTLSLAYDQPFSKMLEEARAYEEAGADILWAAELYGLDAVSVLGGVAAVTSKVEIGTAILNIYSRTPTALGQTAAGLDYVSNGRFILGLGASGPQVIEGFHGIPFDRPVPRTGEIIDIIRLVLKREPTKYDGRFYQLPVPAGTPGSTGAGKPLKMVNTPLRSDVPIFIAGTGEKNVELAGKKANGWFPFFFLPELWERVWGESLKKGLAQRSSELPPLDIVGGGQLSITDDPKAKDKGRAQVALYVGGMGSREQNFYNRMFRQYGYVELAEKLQDLYLSGRKDEAAASVPDEVVERTMLVGNERTIRDRLEAYARAGVTVLSTVPNGPNRTADVALLRKWMDAV